MNKLITLLILFFSLSLFQSEGYSRQSDIAKIRKEIDKINQLTFKKIEVNPGDYAEQCTIYVDNKNRIRKLIYSLAPHHSEGQGSLIEYFNTSEKLIYIAFDEYELDYMFRGNAYFVNGKAVKIDSLKDKLYDQKAQGNYANYYLTTAIAKKAFGLPKRLHFRKKSYTITQKAGYTKTTQFFDGRYRFHRLKVGEVSVTNTHNVILRSKPNTRSKIIGKLNALYTVENLSVGKQQNINPWGKHHWYQVETYAGTKGWLFGAFLEPVEEKIK